MMCAKHICTFNITQYAQILTPMLCLLKTDKIVIGKGGGVGGDLERYVGGEGGGSNEKGWVVKLEFLKIFGKNE